MKFTPVSCALCSSSHVYSKNMRGSKSNIRARGSLKATYLTHTNSAYNYIFITLKRTL